MQTWKIKKKTKNTPKRKGNYRLFAVVLLIATFTMALYDFPAIWNNTAQHVSAKTGWLPPTIPESSFRLGLDLQGGTHLIYDADMSQIPEEDRLEALEGVKDVIERRVNAFGVSEPSIQTTTTGDTYRVLIDLAGVQDISEAIALIGETPVLEFKRPGEDLDREPTAEEQAQLLALNEQERASARAVLNRALAGENFDALVSEFSIQKDKETSKGIIENATEESVYQDVVSLIKSRYLSAGRVNWDLVETSEGLTIFKYLNPGEQTEMLLSHILICFEGKVGCQSGVSAIDASVRIGNLRDQATVENFSDLAKEHSTDPSAVSNGGDLGWSTAGAYVPAFGLAAGGLEVGEISTVVETEFGYHLILKRDQRTIPAYTFQRILMPLSDIFDVVPPSDPWVNTELSGKHLERAAVEFDPTTSTPYVALTFNQEGGELFGALTESHIGQPIAIFLDGVAISTPTVQTAIYGGRAVITGDFSIDEAKLLAQRLNAGALPVPVELLSQQTVGPTLGATSLQKSVVAGLLGFFLVALYMVVFYRFSGFIAVVALLLFAFLNLAVYRLFGVTITLAGIAGLVLSMGMAVDANILIIERFKEEYASGRDFGSAIDEAFRRAWSAIRDGNITTLIAAAVLYWFSSSFIRGFALTLSIGVILSMLTAIIVTRVYFKATLSCKGMRKPAILGVKRS